MKDTPLFFTWPYNLENGQRVYFTVEKVLQRADRLPSTTLNSFSEMFQNDDCFWTLLYSKMPRYYIWNQSSKKFQRQKQEQPVPVYPQVFPTDAVGCPSQQERVFLFALSFFNVCDPTSFQHLRTINGVLCSTYSEACQCLRLLENDTRWDHTLEDATILSNAKCYL